MGLFHGIPLCDDGRQFVAFYELNEDWRLLSVLARSQYEELLRMTRLQPEHLDVAVARARMTADTHKRRTRTDRPAPGTR
jgi:hypothetical protein